jgi:hypothetical protein
LEFSRYAAVTPRRVGDDPAQQRVVPEGVAEDLGHERQVAPFCLANRDWETHGDFLRGGRPSAFRLGMIQCQEMSESAPTQSEP